MNGLWMSHSRTSCKTNFKKHYQKLSSEYCPNCRVLQNCDSVLHTQLISDAISNLYFSSKWYSERQAYRRAKPLLTTAMATTAPSRLSTARNLEDKSRWSYTDSTRPPLVKLVSSRDKNRVHVHRVTKLLTQSIFRSFYSLTITGNWRAKDPQSSSCDKHTRVSNPGNKCDKLNRSPHHRRKIQN